MKYHYWGDFYWGGNLFFSLFIIIILLLSMRLDSTFLDLWCIILS